MNKQELLALADRVEALAGPDREIDAEIAAAHGFRIVDEGHPLGRCCYDRNGISIATPRYTASLDAAMTMVPENADATGERFRLECYNSPGVLAPHVRASAWVAGAPRVYAATPAIALTAAALRAIAAQGGE